MKTFVFDINKAVAASGYIIKKRGGEITVFILLKMLYGGERRALLKWHRPITGDSLCSMPKGPILSRIYDLIQQRIMADESDMKVWAQYISPRSGNAVKLLAVPDFDYLSDREKEVLDASFDEIQDLEQKYTTIAEVLHANWPEWKNPREFGKGSIPIELKDVLEQEMEDDEEIINTILEIQSIQATKAVLQTN